MGVNVKVGSETFGGSSKAWLRTRMGLQDMKPIMLDISTFGSGDVINGYIPSGMPLGKITATGYYGPYNDGASDGTQTLAGFLFEDTKVDTGVLATATDTSAALYWRGVVRESKLPTVTHAIDANGKADVANKIEFW